MSLGQSRTMDLSEPTGRQFRCDACHKPLERPLPHLTSVTCGNCGTSKSLPRSLVSEENEVSKHVATDSSGEAGSRVETYTPNEFAARNESDDDDSEFMLPRDVDRPRPRTVSLDSAQLGSSVGLGVPDDDLLLRPLAGTSPVRRTDYESEESRTNRARSSYSETSGIYPRERHYPTLESMLRLYKIFGYVAVLLVFPYLGFRILYIFLTTKEGLLARLGEFSEVGLPLIFGCVALTATLFGVSEGIKLAIDIQDNTLRIANRHGRKKID